MRLLKSCYGDVDGMLYSTEGGVGLTLIDRGRLLQGQWQQVWCFVAFASCIFIRNGWNFQILGAPGKIRQLGHWPYCWKRWRCRGEVDCGTSWSEMYMCYLRAFEEVSYEHKWNVWLHNCSLESSNRDARGWCACKFLYVVRRLGMAFTWLMAFLWVWELAARCSYQSTWEIAASWLSNDLGGMTWRFCLAVCWLCFSFRLIAAAVGWIWGVVGLIRYGKLHCSSIPS